MRLRVRVGHLLAGVALLTGLAVAGATLPDDSLYQLTTPLTDSHGAAFSLRDLAGKPVVVSMFYGDCRTACPVVLETLQQTVAALTPAQRKGMTVLLVSLHPGADAAARLDALYESHRLNRAVFRLASSDSDMHTRELAAALGIKYRQLDSGEINHSTRVLLLDRAGRVLTSSDGLKTPPDTQLLAAIRAAVASQTR